MAGAEARADGAVPERLQPAVAWSLRAMRLRDARLDDALAVALPDALAGTRGEVAVIALLRRLFTYRWIDHPDLVTSMKRITAGSKPPKPCGESTKVRLIRRSQERRQA